MIMSIRSISELREIARHDARVTPYWCSSARPIRIAANIRTVAAISNVITLAGCKL